MIIQLNLPEHINKMLKIHKAINSLATLEEAVIDILSQHPPQINDYFDDDEAEQLNTKEVK